VKINGLWGFIDKMGRFVINPRFDSASVFRSGVAVVREKGRRQIVNSAGQVIAPN
jgi:hypothetical protein